ncbi:MAG: ANTAR domain-containing protein [Lachnoclostridium sp.]|nr:ANTAR domain-containing protein [Lachnospira sp.]MCM1248786.1 ANTAR domain-containing protein [Lachnoclostridium sp.]MCM1536695.1 ANTAR domain-containing protein [Clostridium sp.]
MVFDGRTYSVLLASASEKINDSLTKLLPQAYYEPMVTVSSVAAAKRALLERSFDFVIVNTPLPDEFGTHLAIDCCDNQNTVVLLLVKAEMCEEIRSKVMDFGVFTLPRPTSAAMIEAAFQWMMASRERLRRFEQKATTLEAKMEEIRIVNRAKWLLIGHLKMEEEDAHHYIEKQAMERGMTRRKVAEGIIKSYQ